VVAHPFNCSLRCAVAPLKSLDFHTGEFPIFSASIYVIFMCFLVLVTDNSSRDGMQSCRYCAGVKVLLLISCLML